MHAKSNFMEEENVTACIIVLGLFIGFQSSDWKEQHCLAVAATFMFSPVRSHDAPPAPRQHRGPAPLHESCRRRRVRCWWRVVWLAGTCCTSSAPKPELSGAKRTAAAHACDHCTFRLLHHSFVLADYSISLPTGLAATCAGTLKSVMPSTRQSSLSAAP